ncbi:hypothetical protein CORT_0D01250 [Candida orthopsilosis Co 90-125]|uniref:Uncharacterized protein n=1 Tax=Candida orthopsilosis (strain 90-125) TaxID=1136231 RepID=H8X4N1_CANO9|nr:hypothetical protein CORT_0D01250 [Candida orthopsilosis Co 90-125]CCG22973.1 hypothetical protein CORT_0D01250 [Candida orthopsilosis Co 90-125]
MFRQSLLKSIRPAIAYRPQIVVSRNYGVIDAATQAVFGKKGLEEKKRKEGELENKAQEVNLDGGRKAASKLDDAQDATQNVKETAKSSLEDAKEGAQSTIQNAADKVKSAAETVNKKTGQVLADGIDTAQQAVKTGSNKSEDLASKTKETVENAAELAYEKRIELEEEEGREEVKENIKGYASLQDKGRKAPIEQNRPDDAM